MAQSVVRPSRLIHQHEISRTLLIPDVRETVLVRGQSGVGHMDRNIFDRDCGQA